MGGQLYIVKAVVNKDDEFQAFLVTTCSEKFQPCFSGASNEPVILGSTTYADAYAVGPEGIEWWRTNDDASYCEVTVLFGAAGHKTVLLASNWHGGFLDLPTRLRSIGSDLLLSVPKTPGESAALAAFLADPVVKEFRLSGRPNTFGVTAPLFPVERLGSFGPGKLDLL